eukprot:COSAG02_NODE_109_length_36250_cov_121.168903_7_plen_69_part_00
MRLPFGSLARSRAGLVFDVSAGVAYWSAAGTDGGRTGPRLRLGSREDVGDDIVVCGPGHDGPSECARA